MGKRKKKPPPFFCCKNKTSQFFFYKTITSSKREMSSTSSSLTRITPPDGRDDDRFGASIAADGNLLAVGAPSHDSCNGGILTDDLSTDTNTACPNSGAVYLHAV